MDITQQQHAEHLEIRLNGRFDAAWSDHVGAAIEAAVRGGAHRIALNFSAVVYLSSLGIRVLLKHYHRLRAVQGSLTVIEPSPATLAVIRSSGLAPYLLAEEAAPAAPAAAAALRRVDHGAATYEIYTPAPGAGLDCTLVGRPERLAAGAFTEADSRSIELGEGSIAVGLGAFGDGYADCRHRFGEFLAAGGAAVTLPTAEQGIPDYVVTEGQLVPRVEVLYAIVARGAFASMLRFDAQAGGGVVGLSALVDAALSLTSLDTAAFAIVAEATGLVGAALRRSPAAPGPSPAAGDAGSPFDFPGVRDWLSFTTERSQDRSLVVVAGVAARALTAETAPFLRPIGGASEAHGHFHAAVFPYRPVQRGELALARTVGDVLNGSAPRAVLHLMADGRPFEGVGETELSRGACWVGPVTSVERA